MYQVDKIELEESRYSAESQRTAEVPLGSTQQKGSFLRSLLLNPTNALGSQFFRYLITGGIALVADFAILYLLTRFADVHYLVSAIAAFLIGLLINYELSSRWVFSHRTVRNRAAEFGIFAAVGVIGLGLNELGLWLLSGTGGVHYLRAKAMTTAIVFLWNFGARKVALFR